VRPSQHWWESLSGVAFGAFVAFLTYLDLGRNVGVSVATGAAAGFVWGGVVLLGIGTDLRRNGRPITFWLWVVASVLIVLALVVAVASR